ncbi:MAG TPA: ABC transporter ATP-binding protein [Bacillales bacterium]|nr:ABC transporter ATP-binding protein [Bacillales bacterium]
MNYVVETGQLTKAYGKKNVVNRVDLRIPKGKIYGFLGPNGAGKTTTIRMLLGLIQPTSGEVRVFGQAFAKNKLQLLGKIGSLVENPSYYAHLNAIENLEIYRILLDAPKSRIHEVLEIVGLLDAAKQKVKQYSLGMKQRLGIATALLGSPELLILDEPTNGLDPQGIHEIRELIKQLSVKEGMTVLVSSHLLSEIDQIADEVGIISKGELIFQDHIDVLRRRAQPEIRLSVDQPEKALKLILNRGIAAESEGDLIFLQDVDNHIVAEIIKRLVTNQIAVYRVEEMKQSLEEIFLDVVKGEEADVRTTV